MAENNKIYITANELAEMLGVSVGHVKKGLEQKMDIMVERELYTKSKTLQQMNITGTFTPLVRIEETIVPD